MKITCNHCQNQMQLDDARVPSGTFKIKCTKCGKVVSAQKEQASDPDTVSAMSQAAGEAGMEVEEYVQQELSRFKKDLLGSLQTLLGISPSLMGSAEGETAWKGDASRSALVCEGESQTADVISHVLRRLGYSVEVAATPADAVKKIDNAFYGLITVNQSLQDDKEGGNKVLAKINTQKLVLRRQMFVVLLSSALKSTDANAAFLNGANIVVNKDDLGKLETLIRDGQHHFQQMYAAFNRVLADKEHRA